MRKLDFNFWMALTWDVVATTEMIVAVFYVFDHNWLPAALLSLASICGWFVAAMYYRDWLYEVI